MKNSNNTTSVPEAKEAMNKFKMEVANELGVNLKQGYNGDLTSRERFNRWRDGQTDDQEAGAADVW